MKDEDVDVMMTLSLDLIRPSSGFAGSVMKAVRAEAAAPAPIPFPVRRAAPGLLVGGGGLLWGGIELVGRSFSQGIGLTRPAVLPEGWISSAAIALACTLGGLLVTAAALSLSMRLIRLRELPQLR